LAQGKSLNAEKSNMTIRFLLFLIISLFWVCRVHGVENPNCEVGDKNLNIVSSTLEFAKSCENPANSKIRDQIKLLGNSSQSAYMKKLNQYSLDCFVGEAHPGLVCLQHQGKKLYRCDNEYICFDEQGLVYKAKGLEKKMDNGFFQWEIYQKPTRTRGSLNYGELIGRVNINFSTGAERVWLNETMNPEELLMTPYDLVRPQKKAISKEDYCNSALIDPSFAVKFTGVDVNTLSNYQNSILKKLPLDLPGTVDWLKGEAVGVRKATWDVLVAITKKETWEGLIKGLGKAGSECSEISKGVMMNFFTCLTAKFGNSVVQGIENAAQECLKGFSGPDSNNEKAGECIGKAIGIAIATATGTKGLQSAITATDAAKTVVGKASGNAAQILVKCIGEACGQMSGKTKLMKLSQANSKVKVAAKIGASNQILKIADGEHNIDQIHVETDSKQILELAQNRGVNDPVFLKTYEEELRQISREERKEVANQFLETFEKLDGTPVQGIKESKSQFQERLKSFNSRKYNVVKVALGFARNGMKDTDFVVSLLNNSSWSAEALDGLDKVLSKSRAEFKSRLKNGETSEVARASAVREALTQMSENKSWDSLNAVEKKRVNEKCQCIGMCLLPAAALKDGSQKREFASRSNTLKDWRYSICANGVEND
jgi:hypothetical protein